eukprot:764787_1
MAPQQMQLVIFLSINIILTYSLSINSVYVIIDATSTIQNPVIELKDHYNNNEQQIGYINDYLVNVYIKGTNSQYWLKMQDNTGESYTINSTNTLNKPMSLKLTFYEEPNTNYTWYSFLSNLQGTTIYHLYINEQQHSPTTTGSGLTTTQNTTQYIHNTIDNNRDVMISHSHTQQHNWSSQNQLFVSLVIVSGVSIIMCIFFISVCCCFYFYRKNDQCHQYEPTPNIKSIYDNENIQHIQHKRKNSFSSSIRINPLAQNSEG